MTLVCVRQPGYLPYIGFFKKIESSDIFVLFDDAQYAIRAWDNRNKIRNKTESIWITVPVIKPFKKLLNQVEINGDDWKLKHIELIKSNYSNTKFFKDYWNEFESILFQQQRNLSDLNIALIEHIVQILDIDTKIIRSSELNVSGKSSEKLLNICKKLEASSYLSGIMGTEYLDETIFEKNGIRVIHEKFLHPVYEQSHNSFIPNLSIIDLIFNEGTNAKNILKNVKNIL